VLLAQSNAALAASGDVLVPAHGSLELSPGVGRLQLNGIARGVGSVPVTLYFASGAQVHLVVPVDGPRQADPVVS
jgi:copper(I)-binding protein